MSDKGKAAAIKQLRKEVGFGCPVCRSPFLTWHHFNPPWHEEEHWRPEDIIAMCVKHHTDADPRKSGANAYSPDELRAMKNSNYSSEDVTDHFPSWQKKNILVRMGGCYTSPSPSVLAVSGVPQISLRRNEIGLLDLSFQLRNKEDAVLAEMEDNWFTAYPRNIHDMRVTAKIHTVKVWLAKQDVGLELSFKRVSMSELEKMLETDRKRSLKVLTKSLNEWYKGAFPELSPEERGGRLTMHDDFIAEKVKQWVTENCQMDDGLIPILNFEQMAIHFHGQRITIKDGMADSLFYCLKLSSASGYNLKCPCPACIGIPMTW